MGSCKKEAIQNIAVKKETLDRAREIHFGPRLCDKLIFDALFSFFTSCESCNKEIIEKWKKEYFKKK